MRRGKIYLNDIYAGLLTEDENGFTFAYDAGFLRSGKAEAVSLTLPNPITTPSCSRSLTA